MDDAICTVLMISYDHEPYIREAIESVLEQETEYGVKIHIFDDGSTDGTQDIIREYAKKYPKKIYPFLAKKNRGAQANIWAAFQSVDTKYFIVLECDDYWCDKKKLQLQIAAMEAHPECSFCGHDTAFSVLDEGSREYAEGEHACTEPKLRSQIIFSLQDFDPIDTGGYIPYASTRLIRTECLHLDRIKYKESVLFDFTQFYYLLLQGKYYYIDRIMSVYQRTGDGTCSHKDPLEFLDTFVANAIDFNKETGGVIRDKIYRDCMLQMSFRLKLSHNAPSVFCPQPSKDKVRFEEDLPDDHLLLRVNSLDKDKFYFLCNGGIGFTMLICGLKKALEKRYGGKIILLIVKEHEFIVHMYGESDYLIVDTKGVNLEALSDLTPNPERGKMFVCHPFAHREQTNYYLPQLGMYSSVNFVDWMKGFFQLSEGTKLEIPTDTKFELSPKLKKKLEFLPSLEKTVLVFPEAYTLPGVGMATWKAKVSQLLKEGFTVVSCVKDRANTIPRTVYIELTLDEVMAVASRCHSVYSTRNGVCDALFFLGDKLTVYYSSHAALFQYGVKTMFGSSDIHEVIVLDSFVYTAAPAPPPPRKAYLFGRFPVPEWTYRFYLRHKQSLQRFKKYVHWR